MATRRKTGTQKDTASGNAAVQETKTVNSEKPAKKRAVSEQHDNTVDETVGSKEVNSSGDGAGTGNETLSSSTRQIIYSLQAGDPIFVTTADICSAFGITKQRVSQLIGDGIIHKTNTKYGQMFNLFEAVRDFCSFLKGGSRKKIAADQADIELKRKIADARLKESKADIAELEAAELQRKMHRSEDVEALTADLLYCVRGGLLAIPGRCAVACAAATEPVEVQNIIKREVFEILSELSDYSYDSKKYEERVKQRANRDVDTQDDADDIGK